MKNFMEKVDINFEMSPEEIDELIDDVRNSKLKVASHDIARIHAGLSRLEEDKRKEYEKKLIEAGIIADFNEGLEDGE